MLLIASFASLAGFLFGYDLALIGGAIDLIQEDLGLSDWNIELVVGGAKIGAVFGTFVGGGLMHRLGRRKAIALSAGFFGAGPLLMAFAPGLGLLVLGRLLIGLGIGATAVVVPAYLGEVSPAASRGFIVEIYEVLLTVGMIAASFADVLLAKAPYNWRWMVGVPCVPGLLLGLAPLLLVESPRWLVSTGDLDGALDAIGRVKASNTGIKAMGIGQLRDEETVAEIEQELLEIWDSVEKSKAAMAEVIAGYVADLREARPGAAELSPVYQGGDGARSSGNLGAGGGQGSSRGSLAPPAAEGAAGGEGRAVPWSLHAKAWFWELVRGQESRALGIALVLAVVNQASASTSIINYGPTVLRGMGVEREASKIVSAALGFTKLVGVVVSMFVVDGRAGRRRLLVWGSAGMAAGMVAMTASELARNVVGVVFSQNFFLLAFSVSWAGVFWVLMSEFFSMRVKGAAQSLVTAIMFAGGALADLVFLLLHRVLGSYSYLVFGGVAGFGALFVFLFLPETKGKPLSEVQRLLAAPEFAFRAAPADGEELKGLTHGAGPPSEAAAVAGR